jgi:hypothetical protein
MKNIETVLMVSVLLLFFSLSFCVVLLWVFTLWVPFCNVRYDIRIKTMFGLSLPPVVCMVCLRYMCLFAHNDVQHILCCVFVLFYLSCLLYDFTFCSVFSYVHFFSLIQTPTLENIEQKCTLENIEQNVKSYGTQDE